MSSGLFNMVPKTLPIVDTKYRCIKTQLPVPESLSIMSDLDKYESRSMHGQYPIVWDRAEGINVYDLWGNKWLDFTSTIFVANAGHGNADIASAIRKTADKPLLHAYNYYTTERSDYIKYLIENTPQHLQKAFLLSAGTEATECALKLMRMYGQSRGKKRYGIISFEGSWHGRTLGAQMMSYNQSQKEWIGYHDPNIYHMPFPYPWIDEAAESPEQFFNTYITQLMSQNSITPSDLCGFMIETFQGWGAVFYPKAFIKALEAFAHQHDLLITFDEMQAGFGRTGKLFGYMHYDIEPDLVCCGKGASSSLPLSFVLGSTEIMDLPEIGSMSSTHSASPMVCAAGKANFEYIINHNLIENSEKMGEIFIEELNSIKQEYKEHISMITGSGLLAAIHFRDSDNNPLSTLASSICETLMQRGLLVVHTGRETIKLAPPLVISEEPLREGLSVIRETIGDCIKHAE